MERNYSETDEEIPSVVSAAKTVHDILYGHIFAIKNRSQTSVGSI